MLDLVNEEHVTGFTRTLNGCNYLSILGLKLNHVSKRGPWPTEDIVSSFDIHDPSLSDENALHFKSITVKPAFIAKGIVYHKWKSLDSTEFAADICQFSLHISPIHNVAVRVKQYNTMLVELSIKCTCTRKKC